MPNLLGGSLPPGDVGYTHLTKLVRLINYPIFVLFQSGMLNASTEVLKEWSPNQLFGYNALMAFLLILCFAFYWYCEGLVVHWMVNGAHNALRQ
jgi:hypothetical protein